MTSHGFRGIASTQIREIGKGKFREEVIEAQLAHTVKNKTQAAYDHAVYIDERIALMQWWSDCLDQLKSRDQVIPFKQAVYAHKS